MAESLAGRVSRLEALGDIRRVMALYARYADNGWPAGARDAPALSRLFTEDGIWDSGVAGAYEGPAAIESYFRELGFRASAWDTDRVRKKFGVHLAINPKVIVDGGRASGVWHGFVTRVLAESRQSHILAGKYVIDFRRTPEGWRIRRLKFVPALNVLNADAWASAPIG